MKKLKNQWSLAYYQGAVEAATREADEIVYHASCIHETASILLERFKDQFKDLLDNLATGPWQKDMNDAPKDGTPILVKFKSGLVQVCQWAVWGVYGDEIEEGWAITGIQEVFVTDEPVAWAEIL